MSKAFGGFIPMVDIIKSGYQAPKIKSDDYERDENGNVKITCTKHGEKIKKEMLSMQLAEHEEQIKRLKEIAEGCGLSKKDLKDTQDNIRDREDEDDDKSKKHTFFDNMMNAVPNNLSNYMLTNRNKTEQVVNDDDDEYDGKKHKHKKDKKKKHGKDVIDGVVYRDKKQKKHKFDDGYRKSSNSDDKEADQKKSEVAERFKEVETISRENIAIVDNTMQVVDARLGEILNNTERIRGKDMALSNYINAKVSLISTRQKIATDILSNRAKVYDIEMKQSKSSKDESSSAADNIMRIFPGIALGNTSMQKAIAEYTDTHGKNKDGKKHKHDRYKDMDDDDEDYGTDEDALKSRYKELKASGDLDISDYDKNIEYEGQFTPVIRKSWQTQDWEFIAMDSAGNIIDVPKSLLPSKKRCNMKFDDEKEVAFDKNSNRTYRVIEVPTI